MRLPESEAEMAGPNLTPVIDVVFLLLIFFLVATQFKQEERELPTVLPEVAQAEPIATHAQELVINVTREGKYIVMRKELTETQLLEYLRQFYQSNPNTRSVLIRADAESHWKFGVRVMGLCNKANIRDYRVAALEGG